MTARVLSPGVFQELTRSVAAGNAAVDPNWRQGHVDQFVLTGTYRLPYLGGLNISGNFRYATGVP